MGASSTGSWNAMDYIVIGGVLLAFVVGGGGHDPGHPRGKPNQPEIERSGEGPLIPRT